MQYHDGEEIKREFLDSKETNKVDFDFYLDFAAF